MATQVISFRVGEEAINFLLEKGKPGESPSQTAQRLLNGLLGTTKEIAITDVDGRIQSQIRAEIAPLQQELAQMRKMLGKFDLVD